MNELEWDTEWANTEHEKDSDQPRLIENKQ